MILMISLFVQGHKVQINKMKKYLKNKINKINASYRET